MRYFRYVLSVLFLFIGVVSAQSGISIATIKVSPNGLYVVGVGGQIIKIWDAGTGNTILEIPQDSFVDDVSWSPDSIRIATVTSNQYVRIWNIAIPDEPIGTLLAEFEPDLGTIKTVQSVGWSPDGQYLVVGGYIEQPYIQFWNANNYEMVSERWRLYVSDIVWNPDLQKGLLAVSYNQSPGVFIISSVNLSEEPSLACSNCIWEGNVNAVVWNTIGSQLAFGDTNGLIQIVDINSRQSLLSIQALGRVNALSWSSDGTMLASASYNGSEYIIQIWDAQTGELMANGPQSHLVAFNPINSDLIYVDGISPSNLTIIPISEIFPHIIHLSLLDSTYLPVTGHDPLSEGTTIDLANLYALPLILRANTNPATVGSVKFELDSLTPSTDDTAPYDMPWLPTSGQHTLTVTPYSGVGGTGTAGTPLTIHFNVAYTAAASSISLIDSSTSNPITGFETLADNATIDLAALSTASLGFRANTNPATVGSVKFQLDSLTPSTDDTAPYDMPWLPTSGQHTLTVTPYSGAGGTGTAGTPIVRHFNLVYNAVASNIELINPADGSPITDYAPLAPNANIDLATMTVSPVSFRAISTPHSVGSMIFQMDDLEPQIDITEPYEFSNWIPTIGQHTLTATPYSNGDDNYQGENVVGTAYTINFTVSYSASVTAFSLINPNTNTAIAGFENLANNASVNLADISVSPLSLLAVSNPGTVGSVTFQLDALPASTDNAAPYEFTNWIPTVGQHTLTATPYSGADATGAIGAVYTINFTVVYDASIAQVSLLNAANNNPITGFDPLDDNATIDLATMKTNPLNIIAAPESSNIGSVAFNLDGTEQVVNTAPYIFSNWTAVEGSHTLTVTPYLGANKGGESGSTLTIHFTVVNSLNRILFVHNAHIYIMNADGTNPVDLGAGESPSFSPNGQKIAYHAPMGGSREIFVMNADGSNKIRLTTNSADDRYPSWSPDGTQLVWASLVTGSDWEIYIMNADGTNKVQITNNTVDDMNPSWSPNGDLIAFSVLSGSDSYIFTMWTNGTHRTQLTTGAGQRVSPEWSPDGSMLVYNTTGGTNDDIWRINADGTGALRLTSNASSDIDAEWSQDGTKIIFSSDRAGWTVQELYIMNISGSSQTRFTFTSNFSEAQPAWGYP